MKTNYFIDKFVDNNGIEREFILAAVSVDMNKDFNGFSDIGGFICGEHVTEIPIKKILCIGIAVKRPEDTYNEDLGMQIAKGKALKGLTVAGKSKLIFVTDSGLVNTKMVQALLEQEAMYFKRDPRCYIASYGKQTNQK